MTDNPKPRWKFQRDARTEPVTPKPPPKAINAPAIVVPVEREDNVDDRIYKNTYQGLVIAFFNGSEWRNVATGFPANDEGEAKCQQILDRINLIVRQEGAICKRCCCKDEAIHGRNGYCLACTSVSASARGDLHQGMIRGSLTIIRRVPADRGHPVHWVAQCVCGKKCLVPNSFPSDRDMADCGMNPSCIECEACAGDREIDLLNHADRKSRRTKGGIVKFEVVGVFENGASKIVATLDAPKSHASSIFLDNYGIWIDALHRFVEVSDDDIWIAPATELPF